MRRLFVITCLFIVLACRFGGAAPVHKALVKADSAEIKFDTSKVNLRQFNAASIKRYKDDPQYDYYREEADTDTWWDRFWRWIWHQLDKLFSGGDGGGGQSMTFGKPIAIALAIGFAVYIIIKVLGLENILRRKSKEVAIPYAESLENINQINFDEAIENYWKQRNYRLAVRLLYLRSLKQLNDARLINWQIGKTNTAYLNEISNDEQRRSFGVLTRQFEYVWYGDFPVVEHAYERINTLFTDFKKML